MRYSLVDRFLEMEPGKRTRVVKCVTRGEPFMARRETYPSALVLEAMFQAGGILARSTKGWHKRSVLGTVQRAEFPALARPGDRIDIELEAIVSREEGTLFRGQATVGETVVGRAEFMILYVPPEKTPDEGPAIVQRRLDFLRAVRVPGLPPESEQPHQRVEDA